MRKLTGLFTALLFALTVSPVMASSTTDDTASNDYTATVNSDMSISFRDDTSLAIADNSFVPDGDNTAVGKTLNGDDVSLTVEPTAGSYAMVTTTDTWDLSSNVNFDVEISTPSQDVQGEFNGTGEAYGLDNLEVRIRDTDSDALGDLAVNLKTDGTAATFTSGHAAGSYPHQDIGYTLTTPDDFEPGTYNATLEWRVVASSN